MRCVILITEDPVAYLVKSTPEMNRKFVLKTTADLEQAEIWHDPAAATAWCEQRGYFDAQILQIDAPVIVRPTELRKLEVKARTMSAAERTAMKQYEQPVEEEEEAPAPKPRARKAAPKKATKAAKKAATKVDTSAEEAQVARELARLDSLAARG